MAQAMLRGKKKAQSHRPTKVSTHKQKMYANNPTDLLAAIQLRCVTAKLHQLPLRGTHVHGLMRSASNSKRKRLVHIFGGDPLHSPLNKYSCNCLNTCARVWHLQCLHLTNHPPQVPPLQPLLVLFFFSVFTNSSDLLSVARRFFFIKSAISSFSDLSSANCIQSLVFIHETIYFPLIIAKHLNLLSYYSVI